MFTSLLLLTSDFYAEEFKKNNYFSLEIHFSKCPLESMSLQNSRKLLTKIIAVVIMKNIILDLSRYYFLYFVVGFIAFLGVFSE